MIQWSGCEVVRTAALILCENLPWELPYTPTNGDDHCDGDQDDVDQNVGYDDGDDGNTFLENFSNTPTSLIIVIMAIWCLRKMRHNPPTELNQVFCNTSTNSSALSMAVQH